MKTLNEKFIHEVLKIKEPEIFLGVARILRVELFQDTEARDFYDICADAIVAFSQSGRKRKRELLKIIQDANKEVTPNADRAENSEAINS